ncbi:hypothetical protein [Rubritepida flocculans]|uniref:hypothetical protein n=1 Tax=Rubritepida flocculans TaxID=182403 RepID=UPI0003F936E1|nr:hypothetical protein [Rubritepida flocculans]
MTALAAIAGGALLLLWPALANGYPILFTDTGAFLAQTVVPLMIWDKPWIYGPFAFLFHQHVTLWGTAAAQALILSHLVWLLARALGRAGPGRHLLLCAGLALFTALPWSVSLIMPDALTPAAILATALLAWGWETLSRGERAWLLLLAPVAAASHLSNLPVLFALLVLAGLMRAGWGVAGRAALPLLGAAGLILATNAVGHGRLALSPHGSTFLLARLLVDGPAARTLAARCPEAGWHLCAFLDRLPTHSDAFLWHPDSPVNREADGTPIFLGGARLSPEAREIVAETLRREPLTVALQGLHNFLRQLTTTRIGDTLANPDTTKVVRPRIAEGFPPAELRRHDAALQQRGRLAALGAAVAWLHPLALLAATPFALLAWARWHAAARPRALGLLLAILVGVAGNALATGALSGVFPRYQARVAWMIPLVAVLFWRGPRPGLPVPGYAPARRAAG